MSTAVASPALFWFRIEIFSLGISIGITFFEVLLQVFLIVADVYTAAWVDRYLREQRRDQANNREQVRLRLKDLLTIVFITLSLFLILLPEITRR